MRRLLALTLLVLGTTCLDAKVIFLEVDEPSGNPTLAKEAKTAEAKGEKPALIKTWYFPSPADFPLSRYESSATHQMEDALIIHEGMRVDFYSNGKWKLTYTTTPARAPVTVDLQFWLETPNGKCLLFSAPPADFRPYKPQVYSRFDTGVSSQKVCKYEESGFSPMVKHCQAQLNTLPEPYCPLCNTQSQSRIVRTGRARAGHGADSLR